MRRTSLDRLTFAFAIAVVVAACGGGAAATPTAVPPTAAPPVTEAPAASTPAETSHSTGEPSLTVPAEIPGGSDFDVAWTGPNAQGDYITIVAAGTATWTTEDYFNTLSAASPEQLTAPITAGNYEVWYVADDGQILVRKAVTVTAFSGSLSAPDSVLANTQFDVTWVGPNGQGDYVTIVKLGATAWAGESYANTSAGNPAKLLAPVEAGAYELWYVAGTSDTIQARRPITITPAVVTLDAPGEVNRGTQFQVTWTGPNGPDDYVTIVPAGSAPGSYLSYANTSAGSPATLTAPDEPGAYEIWYTAGQNSAILRSVPITVK